MDQRDVRIGELEAERAVSRARVVELEDRVAYLAGLVEEVRREGKRQAAPFRKTLKAKPERPGRKAGGGDGAHSFRTAVPIVFVQLFRGFRTGGLGVG